MMLIPLAAWKSAGVMPLPRAGCAIAALGSEVLVAGGTYWAEGRKHWVDTADRFDPATGRWSSLPPVPRLAGDAVGVACGGEFVVLGGGGETEGSREVWATRGGAWRPWPALPEARRTVGAGVIRETVYVVGGLAGQGTDYASATRTLWSCSGTGRWEERAPLPGPARFVGAVTAVGDCLVVAGGCVPDGAGVRNLDEILCYDARDDRWSRIGTLPRPCRAMGGLAHEGRVLWFGGYADAFADEILACDLATGVVTVVGRLPKPVADLRLVRLGGEVLALSGEDGMKLRYADCVRAPLG